MVVNLNYFQNLWAERLGLQRLQADLRILPLEKLLDGIQLLIEFAFHLLQVSGRELNTALMHVSFAGRAVKNLKK